MDETVNALQTPEQGALRLLEKIAANLSGMIFQLLQRQDGSRSILYASSGCRDLFELEPEDVQQDFQAIYNLIHPEDLKAFEESIATSSSQIIPWRWEGRIITNTNKLKWIQGSACPEIRKEGGVVWDGFLTNITDRKQAELSLCESEQKFSKAFRCSPTPISILKLQDGRYVDVNDAFVEISGFSRKEVINLTPGELNIWRNSAEGARIQRMLLEEGFVRNLEAEFYTKSGELKIVLFSAEMITLGEQACVLCVMNDITQRKKTEELLLLSAKRDRLFSQTLTRIRHSLNLDQILHTTVNEVRQFLQADRVFIALRDTSGKSKILAESVDPEYPSVLNWKPEHEAYLLEFRKLLTTNRVRVVEDITQITSPELLGLYQEFRTRATLAVPIILNEEWFGALVANQCRQARHWTAMEIDLLQQMSEQVAIAIQQAKLYQELAQLNANLELQVQDRTAQLQQKMEEIQELSRVKDVVLHTVSHDLRTTVVGNLMVLNNLLNKSVEDKQQRDDSTPLVISRRVIERMIQGNDRQLGMIDSLLEIHASIEQGVVLRTEAVNLSTLVKDSIRTISNLLSQNQANVNDLIPADLPPVIVDPTQLQKVFVNLLTQGLQNNPPGLNFTLKATIERGVIRCIIQDDGVRMSKLECNRLFDLYVRDPQARCSTSIGLKMFLCRQIIKAHGGEMGVFCDNRKQGLTLWFTLPIATQQL